MAIDKAPLNIRNNNPGNLRFVGQEGASQGEGGFAKFDTPAAGMEAMRRQIELDTQKRGLNLTQFLNKYAPPSENKTTNYIDFVAKKTGLDPNAPVPPDLIPKLQAAMIEMEGGPKSLSYFQQTSAPTQVAKATPKAGPRTTVQAPAATAAAIDPKELPSNYTAALALNYLADTDPNGEVMAKVNEMMAEMQESSAPKRPAGGQILMQYAQSKAADPFEMMAKAQEPEPQQQQGRRVVPKMPKMFAEGGSVELDPNLTDDEARKKSQEMLYNMRVNMGPVTGQFVPAPNGVDVRTSTQLGAIRPFVDISPNEAAVSQVGATYGNMTPQGGYEVGVSQRMPIDTPSGKIRMPVTVQGGMNAPIGKNANFGVQGFYVPRQEGMPESSYGANLTYQRRFKNGGDVSNEVPQVDAQGRVIREAPTPEPQYSVGERIVGAGETALSALSGLTAPASIAYDVLRGKPQGEVSPGNFMYAPRTPAGQTMSQDLGRFIQDYKLDAAMPQVQLQRPLPVAAAAKQGIRAIERGAEKAGTAAVRTITGKPDITATQIYNAMGDTQGIMSLGAPAISRMPGGTFLENPESNLALMIDRVSERARNSVGDDPEKATAATEMFTKKAADFYRKRAGGPTDELKQELISGRVKMPPEMDEVFPKYLLDSARKGDINAMRDLERRYDKMIGIQQIKSFADEPEGTRYRAEEALKSNIEQGMLAQFKATPQIIPDDILFKLTNKDPTEVRLRIKENPEYFSTVIEPNLKKLLNIDANIITKGDIEKYPSTGRQMSPDVLTGNEWEAIKRNQELIGLRTSFPDLFGYDIDTLAQQAGKMSTEELKNLNFASFISRATKLAVKEKGLEAQAAQLTDLLKKQKPVSPELSLFGTTEFLKLPDGFAWRKITDPDATILQSAMMDNSIKGYSRYGTYGPFNDGRRSLETGRVELFALYDEKGLPVMNVEMSKSDTTGKFSIRQAQGNGTLSGNTFPEKYLPQLKAFINKTEPTDVPLSVEREIRFIDAPEGFAKGGMVDKPLYDRAA